MKKYIVVGIILLLLINILCGCNDRNPINSDKNKIIGTWKEETSDRITYLTFNKDNSGIIAEGESTDDFIYDIQDNKLILKSTINENPLELEFKYIFASDNILRLENTDGSGKTVIFERVD